MVWVNHDHWSSRDSATVFKLAVGNNSPLSPPIPPKQCHLDNDQNEAALSFMILSQSLALPKNWKPLPEIFFKSCAIFFTFTYSKLFNISLCWCKKSKLVFAVNLMTSISPQQKRFKSEIEKHTIVGSKKFCHPDKFYPFCFEVTRRTSRVWP